MTNEFKNKLIQKHKDGKAFPSNEAIMNLFEDIMALLFPNFSDQRLASMALIDERIDSIRTRLEGLFHFHPSYCEDSPTAAADKFIANLESLESALNMDIEAIYEGDPAAKTRDEIIRSYPGFYAIAAYRIAHQLHLLCIKVIPRIITELAHHRTGIDIHPAAEIDHSFCIDHGTGIVIGETTVIGHHVKLYQGVTLGALSVNKEDANSKRHPTIEPYVVIYANATVLGGATTIGHHSVIGGNSWVTSSVEPYSKVYYVTENYKIKKTN
ncbi:MAG: serine acetyltransferase [Chitinophagales bacterium]